MLIDEIAKDFSQMAAHSVDGIIAVNAKVIAERLEAAIKELKERKPIPDREWAKICEHCMEDGLSDCPDIYCEYYGEPNGCNSPIYGQHPKHEPLCRLPTKMLTLDEAIEHAEECIDKTPCGQNHRQLAEWLKELRTIKEQKGDNDGNK